MKKITGCYWSFIVAIFICVGAVSLSNTALAAPKTSSLAILPVPPGPSNFMWQTLQEQFISNNGNNCVASITIAVSDHATCYSDTTGALRCNGAIYTNSYTFDKPVGLKGKVDQIMLSPTANEADGNAICVHKTDNTVWCMGSEAWPNYWGQFGTGNVLGYSKFVQWGGNKLNTIKRIGTGTWDQMCGLTTSNEVICSGYGFGLTPVSQGFSLNASFYVTTFGTVEIDSSADRASAGRTECTVSGDLNCNGETFTSSSSVVDGGQRSSFELCPFSLEADTCLLNSEGTVECQPSQHFPPEPSCSDNYGQYFGTGQTLALATNPYTNRICAVKVDGSIWCADGGVGTEVQVQPPGSVSTKCK